MIILLQKQMSAWFPRWIRGVIDPNFYEAGVDRACVDLPRKALTQNKTKNYYEGIKQNNKLFHQFLKLSMSELATIVHDIASYDKHRQVNN